MLKRFGLSGLAVLGLAASTAAYADTQPGFYAGVGFGESTIEVDSVDFDDSDTSFKVFGGYAFNEYFAVEASYFDGGKPEQNFGQGSVEVSLDGLNVSAVGRLPIGETFSLFGKLGYASYTGDVTGRIGNVTVISGEVDDEDVSYGIGAAFGFGQFEVRAEYEAIDMSGGTFSFLSLSGLYRF